MAQREGTDIHVVIEFEVVPAGFTQAPKVVQSDALPEVDAAIVAAIRTWRFTPIEGARSVRGRIVYEINVD